VVDLFAQEALFRERVAGVVRQRVDGSLLHLVLNGLEQDKDGRTSSILQVVLHRQSHPVGEHLLYDRLGSSQHQLRVLGADGLVHQTEGERAEDARLVLHVAHQCHDQKRSHVNSTRRDSESS